MIILTIIRILFKNQKFRIRVPAHSFLFVLQSSKTVHSADSQIPEFQNVKAYLIRLFLITS